MLDITDMIGKAVAESGVKDGICLLSMKADCGLVAVAFKDFLKK